jgi:hypothetical protein
VSRGWHLVFYLSWQCLIDDSLLCQTIQIVHELLAGCGNWVLMRSLESHSWALWIHYKDWWRRLSPRVGQRNSPKKLRLSNPTDMTIHWKGLEEHFLLIPLFLMHQFTREKCIFWIFLKESPVLRDRLHVGIYFWVDLIILMLFGTSTSKITI